MVGAFRAAHERSGERDLVMRCVEGDPSAFRSLMESQHRYAYAIAFGLLRDEDDAKDVVQSAFIRVWHSLATYDPEVRFSTWFYKIVVNLCYDKMKAEARRRNIFQFASSLIGRGDSSDSADPQASLERADLCEHILAAAKQLPPLERLVFHLRDVQDLSIAEVADLAGLSVGSVKTNLCYARKRLRIAMARMQERESA